MSKFEIMTSQERCSKCPVLIGILLKTHKFVFLFEMPNEAGTKLII